MLGSWRLVLVLFAAILGGAVGWVAGHLSRLIDGPSQYPERIHHYPMPYHVPEHAGGVSLRFAMVHDVIHERFPKHGPAHYRERDRLTREALARLKPDDPARFPLEDDLGAGLERLGRTDEAIAVIRSKLARQEAKGLRGRDLYTSYANLGTFLIHGSFRKAMTGDEPARAQFREGVGLIRKSVEVNPEAHFGRERWQAAVAEFLLAAMDDPKLLTTFDCVGNRQDLDINPLRESDAFWITHGYGRAADPSLGFGAGLNETAKRAIWSGEPVDDPVRWTEFAPFRRFITKVGAEDGWNDVSVPSHRSPVPFDEPLLGMIGMWRQGGGANPHFALAMGEIMLRAGQRYIAWTAFERASRMAERYWPDPKIQEALRVHCRMRQVQIVNSFIPYEHFDHTPARAWSSGSEPSPDVLRSQFEAELAYGEAYQKAYQDFEADRIAAGVSIDDPHFFDAFHAEKGRIASRSGPEEQFDYEPPGARSAYRLEASMSFAVLFAGIAAMAMALLVTVVGWLWGLRTRPKSGVVYD